MLSPYSPTQAALKQKRARQPSKYSYFVQRPLTVLLVAAVFLTWGLLIQREKSVDRSNSEAVARQFITEVQNSNSHRAYLLTSSAYQYHTDEDNFSQNFIPAMSSKLPDSTPQMILHNSPANGVKAHGLDQTYYVYRLPAKKDVGEILFSVTLVDQPSGWAVEGMGNPTAKSMEKPAELANAPLPPDWDEGAVGGNSRLASKPFPQPGQTDDSFAAEISYPMQTPGLAGSKTALPASGQRSQDLLKLLVGRKANL